VIFFRDIPPKSLVKSTKIGCFINKTPDFSTFSLFFFLENYTRIDIQIYLLCQNLLLIIKTRNMNKAELIDAMAAAAGLSKADAKKALDGFVGATTDALKKGERISLVGFGSFDLSRRNARNGRNPKTGEVIQIAAKNTIRFKAGSELSSSVN
jgi:DNA-binding protein HU-beta